MKKKLCYLTMLTCLMFIVSGCRMYADYTVNTDGTVTGTGFTAYTQAEIDQLGEETKAQATIQTLEDGNQYYVVPAETETVTLAEAEKSDGMRLTEDIFIYPIGSQAEAAGGNPADMGIYLQLSVSLLSDIVATNADVSYAGNKAVFSSNGTQTEGYWYAYTQKGKELVDADTTAPKMKGAKNNKIYKEMPKNITFSDNIYVKEVKLNGKVVTATTATIEDSEGNVTQQTIWASNGQDVSKQGKNTFKVTDIKGNTATYVIYLDSKVPTVKGIKNGKTYKKKAVFYVKDNRELKSITINGKSQKMTKKKLVKSGKYKGYYKYTITKKGSHKIVVKDAAGNKKIIKIKIKK